MSLLIKCRILDTLDDGVIATLLKQSISASSILRVEPKNKGGESRRSGEQGVQNRNMAPNNGGVTKNNTNWEQLHEEEEKCCYSFDEASEWQSMEYFIILNVRDGQQGTPWSVKTEKWLLLRGARYKWTKVGILTVFFKNQNCSVRFWKRGLPEK